MPPVLGVGQGPQSERKPRVRALGTLAPEAPPPCVLQSVLATDRDCVLPFLTLNYKINTL